jgi:RNA binding exosome subunit
MALPPQNQSHANVSAFVHATEDEARVRAAILKILPAEIGADKILLNILHELSPLDETLLNAEFSNHLDERNWFYVRLDKQQAFLGSTAIAYHDSISFSFHLNSRSESLGELRHVLETANESGETM